MRIKQHSKKTLAIVLVIALLCSMSTMLFSMTASADLVDLVVSDDFSKGGKANVNGTPTNRTEAWGLYDYEDVLLDVENAAATEITMAEADFAKTPNEVKDTFADTSTEFLALPENPLAILTYKGLNHATDKIKQLKTDIVMFNQFGRGTSECVCIYLNPTTGEGIYVTGRKYKSGTSQLLQFCMNAGYNNNGALYDGLTGNNNAYNFNVDYTPYPYLTAEVTANYTYNAEGKLSTIATTVTFYTDQTKQTQYSAATTRTVTLTFDHTAGTIKQTAPVWNNASNNYQNWVTYTDDFVAGVRCAKDYSVQTAAYDNYYVNGYDNLSMTIEREVFVDHNALAAQFKTDYADILALETSGVTATNANAVIAAKDAYDALLDGTKDVLSAEGVDAKLAALFTKAVTFIPTANQTAFEDYYDANIAGKTTAVGSEDKFEQAIVLYEAVEDTHKSNVVAKYEALCNVVVGSYINGNTVNYPPLANEKLYALVRANIDTVAYVSEATYKIDAYKLLNAPQYDAKNGGTFKIMHLMNGTNGHAVEFSHQEGQVGGSTTDIINTIRIRVVNEGNFPTNEATFNSNTANAGYITSGGTFCGNALNVPAAEAAIWNTLNGGTNPVLTAENPYLTYKFTATYNRAKSVFNATHNSYLIYLALSYQFFYDANKDGNYNADDGDILVVTKATNCYVKTDATTNYIIPLQHSISETGTALTYAKDLIGGATVVLNPAIAPTPGELFIENYSELFETNKPDPDTTLSMYIDYVDESAEIKTEIKAKVDALLVKAGVTPSALGATIRTDIDQNMGFYISRPTSTATTYRVKEMGAVIAGADYLYEQHKELYKDVDGTVSGGIQYEEGKAVDDIVLAVLFGTNIEAKDKWGINIAARGYVIWTDGAKDIIVYSSNDDAKNDAYYDDKFDTAGTSIRSVNGIIRTIAGAVYNADPDLYPSFKGVETTFGAEYKGVDYTTIKSSLSADGVILTGGARDPEATLKMLIAFKNLITIIANE